MSPLNWIRNAVRNSVIGGFQDAIEELNANPDALTIRAALPALTAPPDDDTDNETPAVPTTTGKRAAKKG